MSTLSLPEPESTLRLRAYIERAIKELEHGHSEFALKTLRNALMGKAPPQQH
jgi:hypothetical protein